jgi:DeoC/LacD family aldolase
MAKLRISRPKLDRINHLADQRGVIAAAAMDQRGSLQKSIAKEKGVDPKAVTPEMMAEFKAAVSKILTRHSSAILLDVEFGRPAIKAKAPEAGLLLAYETTGYDNTKPGRLPDLIDGESVRSSKRAPTRSRFCSITRLKIRSRSITSNMRGSSGSAPNAQEMMRPSFWRSSLTTRPARAKTRWSSPKRSRVSSPPT